MRNWGAGLGMCSCSVPGTETYKLDLYSLLSMEYIGLTVSRTGKDYHETDRVWIPLNLAM